MNRLRNIGSAITRALKGVGRSIAADFRMPQAVCCDGCGEASSNRRFGVCKTCRDGNAEGRNCPKCNCVFCVVCKQPITPHSHLVTSGPGW